MPRTPFSGVRISWLMVARKSLLARLASSAAARACCWAASARCSSVMSSRVITTVAHRRLSSSTVCRWARTVRIDPSPRVRGHSKGSNPSSVRGRRRDSTKPWMKVSSKWRSIRNRSAASVPSSRRAARLMSVMRMASVSISMRVTVRWNASASARLSSCGTWPSIWERPAASRQIWGRGFCSNRDRQRARALRTASLSRCRVVISMAMKAR